MACWLRQILVGLLGNLLRRYLGTQRRDVRLERELTDELDRSSRHEDLNALSIYNLGCVLSRASAAAAKDTKLPPVERAALKEQYNLQAMEFLRQAVAKGHRNLAAFKADRDLVPLRALSLED